MDLSVFTQAFQKEPLKQGPSTKQVPAPKKNFQDLLEDEPAPTTAEPPSIFTPPLQQNISCASQASAIYIETVCVEILDTIMIQKESGIERTTMECSEQSGLGGSTVIIDHYDTAPDSFSIQFVTHPEIADLIDHYLPKLKNALEESMPGSRFLLPKAKLRPVTATSCAKGALD